MSSQKITRVGNRNGADAHFLVAAEVDYGVDLPTTKVVICPIPNK